MKRYPILLLALLTFSFSLSAKTLSFNEAVKTAIDNSGTVQSQVFKSDEMASRYELAKAPNYPKISAGALISRTGDPEYKTATFDKSPHNLKLTATQNLFAGFKDYYARLSAERDQLSQKDQERLYKLNLTAQVASLYFSVQVFQFDLNNLTEQLQLLKNRQKEINDFVKVGRSRRADLLTTTSQIASINAQIEAAQAQLTTNKETLSILLYSKITPFTTDVIKESEITLLPLSTYLDKKDQRPDIHSLKNQIESATLLYQSNRSTYFPTVDLTGNRYLDRSGTTKPSMWDVGINLNFTLFDGHTTKSQLAIANSKIKQSEALLFEAKKTGQKEIEVAYDQFKSYQRQLELLKEAIRGSDEAYQAYVQDYRKGLATLLDVLQSQNNLIEAKKSYDRMRVQVALTKVQLQIATADESLYN